MKPKDTIVFSFRMPEDIHQKMKYISSENERSLNSELLMVVKKYLDSYEKDNGKINLCEDVEN